jgi:hypothetical protein
MPTINPIFAWGLGALLVPLWLHLSRRRQYKELALGTMRFLEEILRERRKRARFEEIPLLLLRLLAVGLLVALFVRPFLPARQQAPESPAQTVVLMDASGSVLPKMAEQARELAEQALRQAPEGSKVTVAQFSDEVAELDKVDLYAPRPGAPTRLQAALDWALDRFATLPPGQLGKVIVIGHFAAADLPSTPPHVWPPSVSVEVQSLDLPSVDNAAVRRVALLTPYVTDKMEIEVVVNLPANTKREVKLEAEGITLTEKVPMGTDRVVFKFHPPRDEVRGVIRVPAGDAWSIDDKRPFAVKWLPPRRIILVDGHPGSTPFEGQAYFIEKALTASGAAHGKTPFQPEIVFGLSGKQGPMDLSGVATVALCGMNQLPAADARLLHKFVASGGGLISVLDTRWQPVDSAALAQEKLFPETVSRPDGTELRSLTKWAETHAIFTQFDGKDGGDVRQMDWKDSFDLQVSPGWKSLATLDGGHQLLVERDPLPDAAEAGRVLVLAHNLNRDSSDLPREPLFVPLVKSLFAYASNAQTAQAEIPPLVPGIKESRVPGIYTLVDGKTEIVAPDATESAVTPVTAEAMRRAFGMPELAKEMATVSAPSTLPESEKALATSTVPWRQEFWPWLAGLLIILLVIENYIATKPPRTSVPGGA